MEDKIKVQLEEEVIFMRGADDNGKVRAEVLIPLRIALEKRQEIGYLNEGLVGINLWGRMFRIKRLIDNFEDFDQPKELTGYLLGKLDQEIDERITSLDKIYKIAIQEGISQIGTEWEYQEEYEYIEFNHRIINEENRIDYLDYYQEREND